MFNGKGKLLYYMRIKNELIWEKIGLRLYNAYDYSDINYWKVGSYGKVLKAIIPNEIDSASCPQCIYYRDCHKCSYGVRNGVCTHEGSKFNRIGCAIIAYHSTTGEEDIGEELAELHKYLLMG